MSVFDKPGTVGDILGWSMTLPMLLSSFTVAPMLPRIVGNFHSMFMILHGQLPGITRFILWIPSYLIPAPLMILAVISGWIMMKSNNNQNKALIPALCLWLWSSYVGMIILGIFYPILQLQSNVSAG